MSTKSTRCTIGTIAVVLAASSYLAFRFLLFRNRYFNVDEMEHLHAAWCMSQGMRLYRDFFEHHGPLWFYSIGWIPRVAPDPVTALRLGRTVSAFWWAGTVALQFFIADARWTIKHRLFSVALLLSFSTFAMHTLETRPDVPSGFFVALIIVLLSTNVSMAKVVWAGLLFGTALFFSPKVVFPVVGLWLGLAYENRKAPTRSAIRLIGFAAAASLPIAATIFYIKAAGSWDGFVEYVLRFNSHLHGGDYGWFYALGRSFGENAVLWIMAGIGLASMKGRPAYGWALIGALIGLIFVKPIPFGQYFLLFAPLLIYQVSTACADLLDAPPSKWTFELKGIGLFVLAGIASGLYFQWRELRLTNRGQIEAIGCVQTNLGPHDQLLDTYFGPGLFRPHAYFYWWLCPDIPETLGQKKVELGILEALSKSACKGYILNSYYFENHPAIAQYAAAHFHSAGCGLLYLRNE